MSDFETDEKLVRDTLREIRPVREEFLTACRRHWDSLCKPIRGFGGLEDMISRIGAIQETDHPKIGRASIVIMGADNGVVREGVSQCGSEVTAQVLINMAEKKSSVCVMSQFRPAEVIPVDIGLNEPVPAEKSKGRILDRAVRRGTGDIALGPAMSREEAISAISEGIRIAEELKEQGTDILIPGEMGIGNTTTSTACLCALFGTEPGQVTGPGAGLPKEGVRRKTEVVRRALSVNFPDRKRTYGRKDWSSEDPGQADEASEDVIEVLSRVGGLDIAGMTGLFLGAAAVRIPAVIDGFIASLSAFMAFRLSEHSRDYMFPSHASSEPGGRLPLEKMGFSPVLDLGMHLGEGTGAAALLPLLDEAAYVYEHLPSFEGSDIETYKPFP